MAKILSAFSLVAAFAAFNGCKAPKYPACKKDTHCRQDAATGAREYCVAGQCQQCREDSDCPAGQACNAGRCEIPTECPCEEGYHCEVDKCVADCGGDGDCDDGEICGDAGKCVEGCNSDIECGSGMRCVDRQCVSQGGLPESCRDAQGNLKLSRVSFEFNAADLTPEARATLEKNAECLNFADASILLEGHCDERGTQEYNLALGENRAAAVKRYLENLGVGTSRISIVSKGKNELVCYQDSDGCHARNRRVEFLPQ